MELHLLQKIVSLLNFRKTMRRELAIYDYAKSAFELKDSGDHLLSMEIMMLLYPLLHTLKELIRYI